MAVAALCYRGAFCSAVIARLVRIYRKMELNTEQLEENLLEIVIDSRITFLTIGHFSLSVYLGYETLLGLKMSTET